MLREVYPNKSKINPQFEEQTKSIYWLNKIKIIIISKSRNKTQTMELSHKIRQSGRESVR
jgi:hypothetical protein